MTDDDEFEPAILNFPPRGAARWDSGLEYGLPPLRNSLRVNDVKLGNSKSEILESFGQPSKIEIDEDDPHHAEWWEYDGDAYGFNTRLFCLSKTEADRERARRPLLICFHNDTVSMVSGGKLSIEDRSIATAGKKINEDVLLLGIPATNDKPLPPYYQCMFWEEDEWVAKVESEKAVLSVSLSEPWWPLEED